MSMDETMAKHENLGHTVVLCAIDSKRKSWINTGWILNRESYILYVCFLDRLCCMMFVVRWLLYNDCCMVFLYDVCCMWYDVCCMMFVVWCLLCDVCCVMFVACCMMFVVWCLLYDACCMMFVVWCLLYDICCMFVVCWLLYDVCCTMFVVVCFLSLKNCCFVLSRQARGCSGSCWQSEDRGAFGSLHSQENGFGCNFVDRRQHQDSQGNCQTGEL